MEKLHFSEHEHVTEGIPFETNRVPSLVQLEKALVRKIDLYIFPCMWIMYFFSYMDRTK